jgi:hypothetical protein
MKNYIKIGHYLIDHKIEITDEEAKKLEKEFSKVNVIEKQPSKKIELEEHNIRVDSNGWIKKTDNNGQEYLSNPKEDIVEIMNCYECPELNGEQLFTWDAARRETKKAGKRMPTDEEFDIIFKDNNKDVIKNIKYCGYRSADGYSFLKLNVSTYWWSSSQWSSTCSWSWNLPASSGVYRYTYNKLFGFSVRCIK